MGHARALISVPDAVAKAEIVEKIKRKRCWKTTSKYKQKTKQQNQNDPKILDIQRELSDKIGLKTLIHFNESGSSGSLTLFYSDLNQLDEIMKRLKK